MFKDAAEVVEPPDSTTTIRDALNGYIAVGSSVIGVFGVVFAYETGHFAEALALLLLLAVASSVVGAKWKRAVGVPNSLVLLSALVFLPLTSAFVAVTGGVDSSMWLLFLIGVLSTTATGMKRARMNLFATCVFMVVSMWGPTILERGVLLVDGMEVLVRLVATVVAWLVASTIFVEIKRASDHRSRIEQVRLDVEAVANESLTAALKEKDILLTEVHHRVKNNLQIISSLLSLQMSHSESDDVRDPLLESSGRVRSMALIHEQLHASMSTAHIDFGEYARRLALSLGNTFGSNLKLTLKDDAVMLPVNVAIPCGLILNELVTNALKYGISPDGICHLSIHIAQQDDTFSMVVSDQGPGVPPNLDLAALESLGLELVQALTRQIRATLKVENTNGATFHLSRTTTDLQALGPSG